MNVNEQIYNELISHDILIERYKASEVEKIIRMLNKQVLPEIQKQIIPLADLGSGEAAIEAQAKIMNNTVGEAIDEIMDTFQGDMEVFATTQAQFTTEVINRAIPAEVGISFTQASPEMLRELAFNSPFQGELLSGWAEDYNVSVQDNILRELRVGMTQGESIPDLTERIIGTEPMAFTDGTWETQLRHAEAVTRTAVNHVNTSARRSTYKENEKYIKGVQFIATLDNRTTLICAEKDNQIYSVGDCPYPPLHFGCRSTTVPATKSLRELGFDVDDYPESVRESMSGYVPEDKDYEEWLKDNPAMQEKVLGKTKAKMFKDGKISLSDAVKSRTNQLTLPQIMARQNIDPSKYASGGLLSRIKNEMETLGV